MYWVKGMVIFQLLPLVLGRGWMAECLRMKIPTKEVLDAKRQTTVCDV
jgi:hypothetical protein